MTCEKADRDMPYQFINTDEEGLRLNSILCNCSEKNFTQNMFAGQQVIIV